MKKEILNARHPEHPTHVILNLLQDLNRDAECPQHDSLREQSGRSMVEMLGVLALIGVLTVVGIAGFRQAITKHRANELMNEASKRAAVVAGQLNMMGAAQGSLSEFTQNEFAGGTFKTAPITPVNGTFKIEIDHVPDDVCNQMQSMAGGIVVAMTPCTKGDDSTILLTYNNDLSAAVGSGDSTTRVPRPEDGLLADDGSTCAGERKGECSVCMQGQYIDSDAVCVANNGGGLCIDGVCQTESLGCMSNGDCRTINPSQCGNGECYCNFKGRANRCTGPTATGECVSKTYGFQYEFVVDNHTYITGGNNYPMDWWTAKNFCAVYGKRMMTIAELGCEGQTYCRDENAIYTKVRLKKTGEEKQATWTSEILDNCNARYIFYSDQRIGGHSREDASSNIICY